MGRCCRHRSTPAGGRGLPAPQSSHLDHSTPSPSALPRPPSGRGAAVPCAGALHLCRSLPLDFVSSPVNPSAGDKPHTAIQNSGRGRFVRRLVPWTVALCTVPTRFRFSQERARPDCRLLWLRWRSAAVHRRTDFLWGRSDATAIDNLPAPCFVREATLSAGRFLDVRARKAPYSRLPICWNVA